MFNFWEGVGKSTLVADIEILNQHSKLKIISSGSFRRRSDRTVIEDIALLPGD
jgi:hypothetical protein